MIEPYKTVIDQLTPKLSARGLQIVEDRDDSVVFSDGRRAIDISTDLRNPAEMSVTHVHGTNRAIWLLENLLEWDATQQKVQRARTMSNENGLTRRAVAETMRDGSLPEFVRYSLYWTVDFIAKHFDEIFDPSDDLKHKYHEADKSALERLGIR